MRINRFIAALCIAVIGWTWSALASGPNFNDTTSKPLTGNSSGNVGIGTTTPQGAFVVTNGNVGIGTWTAANASLETTGLRLIGNGAAAGSVLVSSSTGIGTWMSASTLATSGGGAPGGASSQLQYNNGGSFDGIVNSNVTASGNVGLGTTLSMNKLDVSGGVGIGTGYAGYRTAPTDGLIVQGNVGIGTRIPYQTSSLAKLSIANSGDASALELYTPSISGQGAFNIVAPLSTAITDGKAFSFIVPGENFARGMFYTDGSYGVGPGSAARDLYISRRATSTLMISSDRTTTGTAHLTVTGNVGIGTIAPSNQLAVAGGVGIGTVSYSPFTANAAPSGGMIVQGNVGIGTFSPVNQLDVSGIPSAVSGAQIGATDTTAMTTEVGGGIRFSGFYNATAQATFGSVRGYKMNSTSDNYAGGLRFLTRVDGSGSVSERMRIDSAGNVGIGTTTTQGGLVVTNGNVGIGTWTAANTSLETTGLRLIGNGAAAGSILVSDTTGIGTWMAASTLATSGGGTPGGLSSQLQYNSAGSFAGITNSNVTASGNVGLGTTLSMNKLDVSGGVGIGSTYAGYKLAATNGLIVQGNMGVGTFAPFNGSAMARLSVASSGDTGALDLYTPSLGSQPAFAVYAPVSTSLNDGKAFSFTVPGETVARGAFYTDGSYAMGSGSATRDTVISRFGTSMLLLSSDRTKTGLADLFVTGNLGIGTHVANNKLGVAGGVGIGTGLNSAYVSTAAPSGGVIVQGNIGIGTITPQVKLVVLGGNVGIGTWTAANASLETTGLRLIGNGAAAGSVLVSSSTGIGTWMSASTLPPAAGAWSTGTGTVYTTTGSDNVGIGTTTPQGGLVVTNGNVGIGTFAPTQALDINGNIATSGSGDSYFLGNVGMGTSAPGKALDVSGTMRATDITVGSTGFVVDSSGNVTAVASTTTTGGYTQSGTSANTFTGTSTFSNATKSAIFTGGNVGVGTTTPQAKLAVIGGNVGIGTWTAVNASLETTGIRLIGNGAAAGSVLVSSSTGIGTWMAASTLATSGSTPSGWSTGTGTVYNTTGSDKIGIGTTTPQGGFVVTNGNVGIGTWDTATGALIVRGSTTSGSLVAIGSATGINHGVSVDLYVQNATTDGTAAAFETTSGNISQRPLELIGSSYSLLDVVLHNNNGSVGSSAGIGFNPTVAAYAGGAYSAYSTIKAVNMSGGAPYYQDLTFENNGSDGMLERMRITSTGNVGIGTVVPGSGLSIAGGLGIGTGKNSSFVSAAAPSGGMIVQGNVGIGTTTPQGGLVITNGNVGIGTWATGGGNLIVKGGGNVGINTVYPGSLLDVNGGGLRIIGSGPNVYTITPNSGTAASFFLTGGSGYLYETKMGVSTNTDFLLYQNNTEKLWFRNDGNIAIAHLGGNVGIGTTTPYSKFAVMGGNVGIGTFIASTLFEVGRQKFNVTAQGNVGVGTITPQGGLVITSGNVGIGTWTAANASLETTGLRLIGNGAAAGSVLVSGSTGIGTWMAASTLATTGGGGSPGGSSSQLQYNNGGSFDGVPNSGVDSNGNIGIGTSSTQAKLVVTGGSVGVGTWSPGSTLSVDGSLAIGSGFSWRAAPSNGMIVAGQTCIGCAVVGAATLSVNRDTNANGNDNLILDNSEFAAGKTSTILFNTGGSSRARIYGGLDGSSAAMMSFEVASSEAVRLNSNGNMGLGTMDPQGKLIVVGGNVGIGTWTAGYANLVVRGNVGIGTTNATTADLNVYGSVGIGTAASFNNLKVGNLIATNSEFDNGSQSGAYPLDWNKGNKQKITMAGSFTITMTAPTSGVTNLLLKVVQDGTGSRTPTLAAASGGVKWAGGAAPSWSTAINAVDIVTCYWDGSNYYCVGSLNFQ